MSRYDKYDKYDKRPASISVSGDLGGGADYVRIDDAEEGKIYLEVGHSCVVYFCGIVPVEFLTAAVVNALQRDEEGRSRGRSPQEFLKAFFGTYAGEYVEKLVDAVKPGRQ